MKAMKWITLSVVAAAVACTSLITACGPTEEEPEVTEYTVTYYDGTTVLDTQTVEEGEKATEWQSGLPQRTDTASMAGMQLLTLHTNLTSIQL